MNRESITYSFASPQIRSEEGENFLFPSLLFTRTFVFPLEDKVTRVTVRLGRKCTDILRSLGLGAELPLDFLESERPKGIGFAASYDLLRVILFCSIVLWDLTGVFSCW